jgi:DNA-binding CsgD family transcriptional regulator
MMQASQTKGRLRNLKLFEAFKNKRMPRHEKDAPRSANETSSAHGLSREASERLDLLTPREKALFFFLLEGYTLQESAERLSVKYSTANTHMTNIYKKLNVKSRAELIIHYRGTGVKPG